MGYKPIISDKKSVCTENERVTFGAEDVKETPIHKAGMEVYFPFRAKAISLPEVWERENYPSFLSRSGQGMVPERVLLRDSGKAVLPSIQNAPSERPQTILVYSKQSIPKDVKCALWMLFLRV